MKSKLIIALTIFILFSCSEKEITIIPIEPITKCSMRGLYSVNEQVNWISGTKGVVLHTSNNKDWVKYQDTSWLQLDFRDIHAFSDQEAIIMSSGNGCEIYKTTDGSKTWSLVYNNNDNGIFFDGMDFWDDKNGIAFSDPINNQLFIIITNDGGNTWRKLESVAFPKMIRGEAGFAASGTGIQCVGDSTVYIGTGGSKEARIYISHNRGKNWITTSTPMRKGEASGIYSLRFLDEKNGILVGGNYLDSASIEGNCAITSDGGLTWRTPQTSPTGYMSCVTDNNKGVLVCTGRNGVDVSYDKGNNWKHLTDDAYYSCVMTENYGWLTGREGKMAKIIIH